MNHPCVLLSRGSPLARQQAQISANTLAHAFPTRPVAVEFIVTTGDRQQAWSLEKTGGKGLFTTELEDALLSRQGDIAIHSAKDLPTEMPSGLALAGCLARANPADVLVRREDCPSPTRIATGSPRRRAQARHFLPDAHFCELRGNVGTRLRKIVEGHADATFLAAAGLARLGITSWPGLVFEEWGLEKMIPAAGQAAIAWQSRADDAPSFAALCDAPTTLSVNIERAFLRQLGEGCHTAFAAHFKDNTIHLFHENFGTHTLALATNLCTTPSAIDSQVSQILAQITHALRP
ncbi:MAG: hydroxymethylbilane synthase [Puniceicoccales bacterium]|jgi:hydroxymethylbilane synthase|nr:hydroxymethylbilane synthase [Puniceicoccales bacterium]